MKKNKKRISMRGMITLVIIGELGITAALAGQITEIFHEYFHITLNLPPVLWIFVISIAIGVVVTMFVGRWILKPINKLGKAMQQVADGNFDLQLQEEKQFKELGDIYESFNRMTKELKATEILQTDFISNVSHEFKTPINAIEGYATLLQGSENESRELQGQYIDKILSNTQRLSNLVGNILLLSKVDNQAIPTKLSTYRLDEQIRQAVLQLEPEWEKKEIEFDIELERIEYTGNEIRMQHVWNNLIGNAIKFDPQGGVVKIRLWRNDDKILCTVEDNGPGIKPGDESHIFDRFFQSDSSHKEEGNGLGLALVKQIVKAEGGQVTVANMEKGCRFTIQL
ncbi:MAG: HAMP domain-containing histidine kinase [Firmicutes bacterium]|nr:HAMP domain-containing histidine kinase [Bacillota bacterium]